MKSLGFEGQWLTLCLLAESIAHFSFWLWNGTGLLLKKWFVLSLEACSSYRMSLLTWKLHLRASNVVPVLPPRTMAFVQKHNVILGTLPHSSSLGWILEVHTDTSTHPMPFLNTATLSDGDAASADVQTCITFTPANRICPSRGRALYLCGFRQQSW